MGGERLGGAGSQGCRLEIGKSGHDGDIVAESEWDGDRRSYVPDDRTDGPEGRQPLIGEAQVVEKHTVVREGGEPTVVGEPGSLHGCVAGRGLAREAHGEIVDGFEAPPGTGELLGCRVLQIQQVADWVVAGQGRGAAGVSNPLCDRRRAIATRPPPDQVLDVPGPAPILPGKAGTCRPSLGIHRNSRRPVAGHAHGNHIGGHHGLCPQQLVDRQEDQVPPDSGVLDGRPFRRELGDHLPMDLGDDHPVQSHETDLGPPSAEVDRQAKTPTVHDVTPLPSELDRRTKDRGCGSGVGPAHSTWHRSCGVPPAWRRTTVPFSAACTLPRSRATR